MICQVCKKKEATILYTEIVDNKVMKMHICEDCAKKKGVTMHAPFALSDLLAGLTDLAAFPVEEMKRKCPGCGMTYADFRKTGRLGCSQCYSTFEQGMNALLETIHKQNSHVGKFPKRSATLIKTIQKRKELERKLRAAIESEAFEEAAVIRDKLYSLKQQAEKKSGGAK